MLARCRQCGVEYHVSAFEGFYFGGANYGLCPECSEKVSEVLRSIPRRYESIKTEIHNLPEGFKERVQELHDSPSKNTDSLWLTQLPGGDFRTFSVVTLPDGYTFSCSVVYRGCRYVIESKSEDNIFGEGTKVYAILEYDLIEERTTGKPWLEKEDTEGDYFKHAVCSWSNTISSETAETLGNCFKSFTSPLGQWTPSVMSRTPNPGKPTSDP